MSKKHITRGKDLKLSDSPAEGEQKKFSRAKFLVSCALTIYTAVLVVVLVSTEQRTPATLVVGETGQIELTATANVDTSRSVPQSAPRLTLQSVPQSVPEPSGALLAAAGSLLLLRRRRD